MKKRYLVVGAVLAILVVTANGETPKNAANTVKVEYNIHDKNMPRSRNVFSMETGDAEYLQLERESGVKRAETGMSTAGQQADVAREATTATSDAIVPDPATIGIHGEDVEQNPVVVSAIGCLTRSGGVFNGPSGREKWYNLPMEGVVNIMRGMGYDETFYPYWIREDGVKMLGDYVMVAANTELRPKGSVLETSLGKALVCDHCAEAMNDYTLIDIAVAW